MTLVLLTSSVHRLQRADALAAQTAETHALTTHIEESAWAIAAAERGFLATENTAFLARMRTLKLSHDHDLALLAPRLTPSEGQSLRKLHATITHLIGWTSDQIVLARQHLSTARSRERSGIGIHDMALVERDADAILAQERSLEANRFARASALASRTTLIAALGFGSVMFFAIVYVVFMFRSGTRRIRRLRDAMAQIEAGNPDARVRADGVAEIGEIEHGFNSMADAIVEQRDAAQAATRELAAEKRAAEELFELAELLAAETDLVPAARIVIDRMSAAASASSACLYALDETDDGRLHLLASSHTDLIGLQETLIASESAAGAALRHGCMIKTRTDLHVPLLHAGQVLGVVSLSGSLSDPATQGLLGHMADQSALALAMILAYARAMRLGSLNETLIESSRDGIRLIDVDGAILAQNSRMTELIRLATGRPSSGSFWGQAEAVGPRTTDPKGFAEATERLRADPDAEHSYEYELADSGFVLSRFAAPVYDASGMRTGAIIVLRDVTTERQTQRMKDEFVATVTHELRTPLTSILGYLELLTDDSADELGEEQRHFIEVIDRNAGRLLSLVNDLLFVGRLESGMLELELTPTDANALLADAIEAARPTAEAGRVALSLSCDDTQSLPADRLRLAQLIDNLLSNAIKFTPGGGSVSVSAAGHGDRWVLEIADTGIGVPDSEKERLFERFYRASTASAGAVQGTGLGLSITKAIAEAHGGSIAVRDTPGGGTTFRVELPLASADTRAAA